MKKKEFKAESKRLMDLMINSIYTNKDIFLREIISNASDALDKLHYESLTNKKIKAKDLEIFIDVDKEAKTITVSDNGIGMTEKELEENLGTIAQSDSYLFKMNNSTKDANIIGQFGVGFYSAFMVASKVEVISRKYNEEDAHKWTSTGVEGYTIEPATKDSIGTSVIITLKDDNDDYTYSDYLNDYKIEELISKYSNYIRYPIKMKEEKDVKTLNEMKPIWKKDKKSVKKEDYENFYMAKFSDYEKPLKVIKYDAEGLTSFNSLLFIPTHAPYAYYSDKYEKGLKLYSNGVLIMDNAKDILPDHYAFIKGVVDSEDLSLNISREILQQDKELKTISKSISKKINNELKDMLKNDLDNYKKFYKEFGMSLKMGIYNSYGMLKDELEDLLIFASSTDETGITLKDYVSRIKGEEIYYAVGESIDKIKLLPQVESVLAKGYEVLYLTDYADEFVIQVLNNYENKKFTNVANASLDLDTEEERDAIKKVNIEFKDLLSNIKDCLKDDVKDVKFTNSLNNHAVCLATEGEISTTMEKVINAMPTEENISSSKVLMINNNHPIASKIKNISSDSDLLSKYAKVLYAEAKLIEGLSLENPSEISDIICDLISK